MFCPFCGANLPDDSVFCEECGSKITDEPVQMTPASRVEPVNVQQPAPEINPMPETKAAPEAKAVSEEKSSNNLKYIITAVIAVAVIGIGVFVVSSMKKSGGDGTAAEENSPIDQIVSTMNNEPDKTAETEVKSDEAKAEKEEKTDSGSTAETKTDADSPKEQDATEVDALLTDVDQATETTDVVEADTVNTETASSGPITAPTEDVTLGSFDWYYNEGFPTDGRPLTTLKEICGKWICMLTVTSEVSEGEQTRILLSLAEVTAADDEVKLRMRLEEKIDYLTSSPDKKNSEKPEGEVIMTYNGSWDELMGYINASSVNSDLGIQLRDYVEVSGKQYAIGVLYNGDIEIGDVVMVR